MATIADLVVNLTANIAQFRTSMTEASTSVTELTNKIQETTKRVAEFLAVREVVNFVREASEATLQWSRQVEELSSRMGITTEAASDLAVSARQQGVELSTLEGVVGRVSTQIARQPKAFQALGIAIRDSTTHALLPMNQIIPNIVAGLEKFQVGSNRDAAAASLFGRGAGDMVGQLERINDTYRKLPEAQRFAQAFGLEMTEGQIAKSKEWEEAVNTIGLEYLGLQAVIGRAVLPEVTALNNELLKAAESGKLQKEFDEMGRSLSALGVVIEAGWGFWERYRLEVDAVITVVAAAVAIFTGAWIPAIIASVVAMGGAAGTGDALGEKIFGAGEKAHKTVGDLLDVGQGAGAVAFHAGKGAAGMKQFTEGMAKHGAAGVSLSDQFDKLKLKLEDQVRAQQLLNTAATQGSVATRNANTEIAIQRDLLTLYNEKTHTAVSETSAYGQAISGLEKQYADLKATTAAGLKITDLKDAIDDQRELTAAQAQGTIAVNAARDAQEAANEIERLGIDAKSAQAAQIRDGTRALNEQKREGDLTKQIYDMQRQISQQEQMVIAWQNGSKAAADYGAHLEALNRLEAAGIPVNSALGQSFLATADKARQVNDQVELAKKATTDYESTIKTVGAQFTQFGDNIINAFEGGKNASKSFKDQVLSDFETLLKQLEDDLLKTLVFDRLQKGLEAAFTGATGAGAAAGAALGTPGGGAGGLGGGGGAAGTGGGGALASLSSLGSSLVSKIAGLFGGTGGAGAASIGAGAAAGASTMTAAAGADAFTASFESFQSGGIVRGGPRGIAGLGADAVPIIAHRGEEVIPRDQVGRNRGMTIHQNFVIHTPDANSFRAAQSHIMADAHRAALAAGRRS